MNNSGDVPLISTETISGLLEAHESSGAAATMLTIELDDPASYGRVVRDGSGGVERVVEAKAAGDADPEQLAIREINAGTYAFDAAPLRAALEGLSNDNAQGEYYLTDVAGMAAADVNAAEIVRVDDARETEGANDPWQLAQLERAFQQRAVRALCLQGARVADPARIDIRGEVVVGRDVEIDVDVVFEGRVELGDGVRIGPFTRLKDVVLGPGTEVRAHCDLEGARAEGAEAGRRRRPCHAHRAHRSAAAGSRRRVAARRGARSTAGVRCPPGAGRRVVVLRRHDVSRGRRHPRDLRGVGPPIPAPRARVAAT